MAQLELLDDTPLDLPRGFHFLRGYFDDAAQRALVADLARVLDEAPLFTQAMPRTGAPLSVKMSNAGDYGWVTDREHGYRYQATHPQNGRPWPPIPQALLDLWTTVTHESKVANLCLINFYDERAKLGLHQDGGESSLAAPVVSVSLGDDATFVIGGATRKSPTRRLRLRSGDVVWFGGESRMVFHGVDGIEAGTSRLFEETGFTPDHGRINLTLRRIDETR